MSGYIQERFRLTSDVADYITEYGEKHNIKQRNRIVNEIVREHANTSSQEQNTQKIIQTISENISKEVNKEISRIRLGTNNTDRNTQILIELIVGYMFNKNVKNIVTTDDLGDDVPFKPYETAKAAVRERIEHQKQRKDNAKKG